MRSHTRADERQAEKTSRSRKTSITVETVFIKLYKAVEVEVEGNGTEVRPN